MSLIDKLNFNAHGLIPAIICAEDNAPLTLCYMNREALKKTLETGKVHVFRRSLGRVMLKGETSGHTQEVKEIYVDCEGNSLLLKVHQHVAACHQGYFTCYFRKYNPETDTLEITQERMFDPGKVYESGE